MAYGTTGSGTFTAVSNLISNSGVVASDQSASGTPKETLGSAGYSFSA